MISLIKSPYNKEFFEVAPLFSEVLIPSLLGENKINQGPQTLTKNDNDFHWILLSVLCFFLENALIDGYFDC